jgi:hypothetical protein
MVRLGCPQLHNMVSEGVKLKLYTFLLIDDALIENENLILES